MIRYLKYIVLVFGGIGFVLAAFFYFQNQNDINTFLTYRGKLQYEEVRESCEKSESDYYYPCFKPMFQEFLSLVSLTGSSIGLKLAFNFMDEDKKYTTIFRSERVRDLHYTLNYLEINNMVILSAYNNYKGMDKLYAGFIISLERFYKKAYEFSDNLITGVEGDEGIRSVPAGEDKVELSNRLESLKNAYYSARDMSNEFLKSERDRLEPEQ